MTVADHRRENEFIKICGCWESRCVQTPIVGTAAKCVTKRHVTAFKWTLKGEVLMDWDGISFQKNMHPQPPDSPQHATLAKGKKGTEDYCVTTKHKKTRAPTTPIRTLAGCKSAAKLIGSKNVWSSDKDMLQPLKTKQVEEGLWKDKPRGCSFKEGKLYFNTQSNSSNIEASVHPLCSFKGENAYAEGIFM